MRGRISTGTTFIALMLVLLVTAQAAAAVSWGTAKVASAAHGFSTGRGLATTKSGSTTYLHQVYVNNYPGGTKASDAAGGTREAVMYQRRTATGVASGSAFRVNKSSQHGNGASIAAAGSHVYVVWSHLAKYAYGPTDARTLQFRSNASNGSGAWSTIKSLTTTGRVDSPSVAAAGSYVYIGYTNAATGAIKLLISDDFGANFHNSGLSMDPVTYDNGYGYFGTTSVAAAGSNVAMAWLSGDTFTASAWTSTITLPGRPTSPLPRVMPPVLRVSPRSGIGSAVAIATPAVIRTRVWVNGSLGQERTATTFSASATLKRSYTVDVALGGTTSVGLAWNACRNANCLGTDSPAKGQDLIWRELADNGAHWKAAFTLQACTGTSATGKQRRLNAYASALFLSATKRVVTFDAFNSTFTKGSVLLHIGSGAP